MIRPSLKPVLALLLILCTAIGSASEHEESASSSHTQLETKADWPSPVSDSETFGLLLFDLLEYQPTPNNPVLNWEIVGWRGGDLNRLWIKSEGSSSLSNQRNGETDIQLLYGRLVTAFFDAQIGARLEQVWGNTQNESRWSAVIGLQGISLYIFEIESSLFVGDSGRIAGRFAADKDFLLSQKVITQFRFEANAGTQVANQSVPTTYDAGLGLRLRYEIKREFAPYVGVTWTSLDSNTASSRKVTGADVSEWKAVGGLRIWY